MNALAVLSQNKAVTHKLSSSFVAFVQPRDANAAHSFAVQDSSSPKRFVPMVTRTCHSTVEYDDLEATYLLLADGQSGSWIQFILPERNQDSKKTDCQLENPFAWRHPVFFMIV